MEDQEENYPTLIWAAGQHSRKAIQYVTEDFTCISVHHNDSCFMSSGTFSVLEQNFIADLRPPPICYAQFRFNINTTPNFLDIEAPFKSEFLTLGTILFISILDFLLGHWHWILQCVPPITIQHQPTTYWHMQLCMYPWYFYCTKRMNLVMPVIRVLPTSKTFKHLVWNQGKKRKPVLVAKQRNKPGNTRNQRITSGTQTDIDGLLTSEWNTRGGERDTVFLVYISR